MHKVIVVRIVLVGRHFLPAWRRGVLVQAINLSVPNPCLGVGGWFFLYFGCLPGGVKLPVPVTVTVALPVAVFFILLVTVIFDIPFTFLSLVEGLWSLVTELLWHLVSGSWLMVSLDIVVFLFLQCPSS